MREEHWLLYAVPGQQAADSATGSMRSGCRGEGLTARTARGVVAIHWPVPFWMCWLRCLLAILRLVCWLVVLLVRHLHNRHVSTPGDRAACVGMQLYLSIILHSKPTVSTPYEH